MNELTSLDTFRLKFKSQTYSFNWFRGTWSRTWPLPAVSALLADFPMSRTYISGHVKPSAEVSR